MSRVRKGAFQQAIDSGHSDAAPKAEVNLGVVLEGQGDVAGAKVAYEHAIKSGHPDAAPMAENKLRNLLNTQRLQTSVAEAGTAGKYSNASHQASCPAA